MSNQNETPKYYYNQVKIDTTFIGILGEISKISKILNDNYNIYEDEAEKKRKNYFNKISIEIKAAKDSGQIYKVLLREKRSFENKIIFANIEKNSYNRKYNQQFIDIIIEPLILQWKSEAEPAKKIPEIIPSNQLPALIATTESTTDNPAAQENNIISHAANPDPEITSGTETDTSPSLKNDIPESAQKIDGDIPALPQDFEQITNLATRQEILDFFLILAKDKNEVNDKPYMEEKEIIELCEKNFSAFNCKPTGKYFDINLTQKQKVRLRYFIYQFFSKYEGEQHKNKILYARLIVNNFNNFKNTTASSHLKNMCESHKPKNNRLIHVEKCF